MAEMSIGRKEMHEIDGLPMKTLACLVLLFLL